MMIELIDARGGQCRHRLIDSAKSPFISGYLPVGMHVPLAKHQRELLFGEVRIDKGEGNAVERQVPSRIPWVLPLVRHGNHICVVHVGPLMIASALALLWRGWGSGVSLEPILDYIVIELFGPEHSRKT